MMHPSRAAVAAGISFVVLLLVAAGVIRTVAQAAPDVPPGPKPQPLVLNPATRIEQTFFMPPRQFSQVTVRLARPGPVDGRLRVAVDRLLGTDLRQVEEVVAGVIDLRGVQGESAALRFAPVPRAWDQYFRVCVELTEGGRDKVALLVNARSTYRRGMLRVDGREQWGDLVFSAGSPDGSLLTSLGLMQGGVPAGLRSGAVLIGLLVLFVAAASGAVWTVAAIPHDPGPADHGSAPETVRPEPVEGRTGLTVQLWIVLALYLAGAGLFLLVTPPLEAPDEPSHFDFVRYIAVNRSLPREPQQNRSVWYDTEWFQPPLYYAAMSPVAAVLDAPAAAPLQQRNPRSRTYGGREVTRYTHSEPAPAPFIRVLFALRLASVVFGGITIWLLFRLVRKVSGSARTAALATMGLLLVPQFTAMSAVVNNDGLATMLAAVAACLIFTAGRETGSLQRTILIGLVAGLAIATKLSTAFLVPMMGVALLLRFWRDPRRLFAHGAVFAASATLAGGWVFLRNWLAFGDPLAREFTLAIAAPLQVPMYHALTGPFFLEQLPDFLYRTFWASFGWVLVEPPRESWVWTLYLSLTIALIALFVGYSARVALARVAPEARQIGVTALSGIVVNFAAFLWYASIWSANQSRYFYPTLGPALLLMTPAVGAAGRVLRRLHPALDRWVYALLYVALAAAWLVAFEAAILRFHYGEWS